MTMFADACRTFDPRILCMFMVMNVSYVINIYITVEH